MLLRSKENTIVKQRQTPKDDDAWDGQIVDAKDGNTSA